TALWLVCPLLGQRECAIQSEMALRACIGQTYPDLAMLDPTGCATLWSGPNGRRLAFFEHPCLLSHEHGVGLAQRLDHRGAEGMADLLSLPRGPPQHMLEAIRGRIPNDCGDLPSIRTLDGAQQAPQIRPHPMTGFAAGKVWHDT